MYLDDCNDVWHGLQTRTGFSIRNLDISDSYLLHLRIIINHSKFNNCMSYLVSINEE